MVGYLDLLRNGVLLDSETLGLTRGSPIHEVALYDLDSRKLTEYLPAPRAVVTQGMRNQDITRLASSPLDQHRAVDFDKWSQALSHQVLVETGQKELSRPLKEAIKRSNSFLYEALYENGKHPQLLGLTETQAQQAARMQLFRQNAVVSADLGIKTTMDELIRKQLPKHLAGKTVWIANAAFESKQIGAQIGAMMAQGTDVEFKKILETFNPESVDPLYVTGKEVNKSRVIAQQTGNWTGVWKAYKAHTPKAGQTAVRDIQDVTRAFMSYGRQLGLISGGSHYFGSGIDLTARLFGSLESDPGLARKLLGTKEVHRAAEDVAVSERYVLEQVSKYTQVLQEVEEGTATGRKYIQQAGGATGPLAEAAAYFARLEHLAPELQKQNLIKRLVRAEIDIINEGQTFQVQGISRVVQMKHQIPGGEDVMVPRAVHNRVGMDSMDELMGFLRRETGYSDFGVDVDEEHKAVRRSYLQARNPGR